MKLDVPITDDKQSAHLKLTGTLEDRGYNVVNGELVFERTLARAAQHGAAARRAGTCPPCRSPARSARIAGRAFVALINLNAENSYKVTIRARRAA